ncbi:flavodoxin-like protein [Murinocardiopsis flavida]|uniref:Flavodoxin-like protein n=1 Tax=Murinocardiopsis flavida TaxID=645275 RepID=A0A2P8DLT7_9ACTN|nr:flavodoxin family protein [Murinocardiopsis flavida]PSK98203.1 flavodoxin-like protein [Murinocardiopsis flavida]
MKLLIISASPRLDGNSHLLADAAEKGARDAGHEVEHVALADYVDRMLDHCRLCRRDDGTCSITDGYEELLFDKILPADGVVFAMPLWFYGMPARLKTVFDRLFCHTSAAAPARGTAIEGIMGKRVGVLISAEESNVGATLGVVAHFQEITRYLNQELVGVVVGVGNTRGEVAKDPADPVGSAAGLGRRFFTLTATDYRVDTARSQQVWS